MIPLRRRSIVLLGMMTKMPVPGVIWQTLHYLLGFRRLGYDVVYAEAHARAPLPFMEGPTDPGTARAAAFLHDLMARFDLDGRWAYHALHEGGACFGMGLAALRRAYDSASAIVASRMRRRRSRWALEPGVVSVTLVIRHRLLFRECC